MFSPSSDWKNGSNPPKEGNRACQGPNCPYQKRPDQKGKGCGCGSKSNPVGWYRTS